MIARKKSILAWILYADGCINEYKNKSTGKLKAMSLELGLKYEDRYHIEAFVEDIEFSGSVKDRITRCNGKSYKSSRVTICNTEICRDLIKLGCKPRKSLALTFPDKDKVPEWLLHHFIRGYFDGDGIASVYYINQYSKYNYRYGFVGTENMLDGVQSFFFILMALIMSNAKTRAKHISLCIAVVRE